MSLTPDQLLTTTRAVRRRLDLTRPVEPRVIEECIAVAQQAPTASNRQGWHFVVVTNPKKRDTLANLYRKGAQIYASQQAAKTGIKSDGSNQDPRRARFRASIRYLGEHLHEVPVLVIPCISGRPEGLPTVGQAAMWGSIFPAAWSFMLAARARGLGTTFTSLHLYFEEEAAKMLGIPFKDVTQVALMPVAYTRGVDFKPGPRGPLASILHWDAW